MNWSSWSSCTKTCGGGNQMRTRKCNGKKDDECVGSKSETRACNTKHCPVWSSWSGWSTCSKTCGSGIQARTRKCSWGSSSYCGGSSKETKTCNTKACPVWSSWSSWTSCSKTCGSGSQTRSRKCSWGSSKYCSGSSTETKTCNTRTCPVWSSWSSWSTCSKTCAGGTQSRSRKCSWGSSSYCKVGSSSESRKCNTRSCPTWNSWSSWSSCLIACRTNDKGSQRRTRTCSWGSTSYCKVGKSYEYRTCNGGSCALTYTDCLKSYTAGHGSGAKTTFSDSKFVNHKMDYLFVYYDSKGITGIRARYEKGGSRSYGPLHGSTSSKIAYIYVNGNTGDAITRVTGTAGTIVDSLKVYRKNSGGTSSYGNPSGGKGFDTSSATSKNCRLSYLSGSTKTLSSNTIFGKLSYEPFQNTYIGSLKFSFVCCKKAEISFKVRAKTDAHVLLSQNNGADGHEIVIGGWSNTQSAIRDSKQKPHPGYAVTKTSNYLSSSYYRGFWINLKDDGMKLYVSVGRLYYSSPFMSYALNYKHSINWIGFAAWEKHWGYFIYENKSYAPYGYKYSYIRASNLLM